MVTCEPSVVETQSQVDSGRIYQWIVDKSLTNWIGNLYLTSWISQIGFQQIGLSIYIWQAGFPNNGFSTDICHRDWWCGGVQAPRKKSIIVICKTFCDIFGQCAFEYCYCLVIFFTTIYFGTFRFVSFTLCYGTYRWDFNNLYAFDTKTSIGGDDVLVSMQTCISQ